MQNCVITCATPVTVRGTPWAVSTFSHTGFRVITSRDNLAECQIVDLAWWDSTQSKTLKGGRYQWEENPGLCPHFRTRIQGHHLQGQPYTMSYCRLGVVGYYAEQDFQGWELTVRGIPLAVFTFLHTVFKVITSRDSLTECHIVNLAGWDTTQSKTFKGGR